MDKATLNKYFFATVFITGASVLIVEVAAVRVLSPIYGSSLYVLSSVLTIILAALSIGYWYGGKCADKEQSTNALYSLITTSGLFVLGITLLSKTFLHSNLTIISQNIDPLIYSFLLFFIPAFLLGIVSPYVIKLQLLNTPQEHTGSVVGNTFFWGTTGSIVGSIATGFILIPSLGVTSTILLTGAVLVSAGLLIPILIKKPIRRKRVAVYLSITILIFSSLYLVNTKQKNTYLYSTSGIYSEIHIEERVINNKNARVLLRDSNNSSAVYLDSKHLVFPYTRFSLLYNRLAPDTKQVLVLGGGAYTIPRTLTDNNPNLKIDVVEIEPSLFTIAQEYFDLSDTSQITNYPVDARVFLRKMATKKYDFIFGDIFGTNLAPPFHLTTLEFYTLVSDNLNEGGVFILNVVGKPKSSQPSLIGSFAKTLHSSFPVVKAYGLHPDMDSMQNVIFVARKTKEPIILSPWDLSKIGGTVQEIPFDKEYFESEKILTDDHAPVTYLMSKQ